MNLSGFDPKSSYAEVLIGERAILERLPALRADTERWGQLRELEELPYLLSVPIVPRREPLLLLLHTFARKGAAEAGTLLGGVLVFAYSADLFGRRLIAHPDRTGRRCVFGPASDRSGIAVSAARVLLEHGAALTVIPFRAGEDSLRIQHEDELAGALRVQNALCTLGMMGAKPSVEWTLHGANRPVELPLFASLDDTLAQIGKRTRRNLRAATRHFEREFGCRLEWEPALSERDLTHFNSLSTHSVRRGVVRWRYGVWKHDPEAFLAGLRSASGEWLALAGGRRTRNSVTLDWQMNKMFPRFSISLVMRGLLMEGFGREGLSSMRFEGGTTHTLVRGFRRGAVYTLCIRRKALWLKALEGLLTKFLPSRAITHDLFSIQTPTTPGAAPSVRAKTADNPTA